MIGDGSGSQWDLPIGWACVALERESLARKVFWGAANNATVTIAELMAYIPPLLWYASKTAREREMGKRPVRQIHIITDSQHVQSTGEGGDGPTRAKNNILWQAYAILQRHGLIITWHWLPRDSAALNSYADVVSKLARGLVKDMKMHEAAAAEGLDLAQLNPWD